MLVDTATPATVIVRLTSLGRRMSSGTATPGTVTSAGELAGRSTPSIAESACGNASLLRVATHHGRTEPSSETATSSRTLLSGGTATGFISRCAAPETD